MTTQTETQGAVGTITAEPVPQLPVMSAERERANIERQREMYATTFDNGVNPFSNGAAFKLACQMAEYLAGSNLVPDSYRGNPADMLVVIDYSTRLKVSPIMLAQNMDVVKGRPGLRGTFLAGIINACPLFSRLHYEWRRDVNEDGSPAPTYGCRAVATNVETGEALVGTWIDWAMVTGEGWASNKKWTTMRDQMFTYRATSFWSRVYASDITLGLYESDELDDIAVAAVVPSRGALAAGLNRRIEAAMDSDGQPGESVESSGQAEPDPAPRRRGRRTYAAEDAKLNDVDADQDPKPDPEPEPEKSPNAETVATTSFNVE